MNLISIILLIVIYICALVLYLHMTKTQQNEERNVALLATASVFFAITLIILLVDIGLEYTRDKRTEAEINRDKLKKMMKAPAPPPVKKDTKYSTVRNNI